MPLVHQLLLLVAAPLVVIITLLIGHLVTLRGLRGYQRIAAFRIFADAMKRR